MASPGALLHPTIQSWARSEFLQDRRRGHFPKVVAFPFSHCARPLSPLNPPIAIHVQLALPVVPQIENASVFLHCPCIHGIFVRRYLHFAGPPQRHHRSLQCLAALGAIPLQPILWRQTTAPEFPRHGTSLAQCR
jgi:hypothetical protein